MRVLMLDTCVLSNYRLLRAGDVIDLDDALARSLIANSTARAADEHNAVEETAIAPASETATTRPHRRRK